MLNNVGALVLENTRDSVSKRTDTEGCHGHTVRGDAIDSLVLAPALALERGMDAPRARGLLAAQMPIDVKIAVADVVVDNSGGATELAAEVDRAWREIEGLCGQRRHRRGLDVER